MAVVPMDLDQIAYQLENSTTLKLLKSEYASLAVGFFFHAFKKNYKAQISEVELKTLLEIFVQQDIQRANPDLLADRLIGMWCDDKHRFLRRFYDNDSDTPTIELSYDTERALQWVESLEKREFVGTHSRFFMIFENLKTIVEQTYPDPQKRLKYLEQQKKELNLEIKEIQQTGAYKRMDATQVRERFLHLIDDSRRLISDFGLVEEIFKELTQKIKEKKLVEFVTKGQILGEILDAYDYLEDSDQGKSFNAFWDFLMSAEMQQDLNEMINQILSANEVQSYLKESSNFYYAHQLKKLKSNLLQVGKKVLQSKLRLSEELRKLLHQKALQENRQVVQEINEIKKYFIENKDFFLNFTNKEFLTLEFLPEINLPMERPLWDQSSEIDFADVRLEYGQNDEIMTRSQLEELKTSFYLNPDELKKRILNSMQARDSNEVSLKEVISKYPIEKGISEFICYLDIAQSNQVHLIDQVQTDFFVFSAPAGKGSIVVPQVVFLKSGV
jgi:hypothetical protein